MNYVRIFRIFRTLRSEAQGFRADPARGGELANTALVRAKKNQGALARIWGDMSALIRLVKAWASGHYRTVPWHTISLSIAALLYFVSPIDAIPDFIPVLGFVDDIFIVTWVMRAIQKDADKFRAWESGVLDSSPYSYVQKSNVR